MLVCGEKNDLQNEVAVVGLTLGPTASPAMENWLDLQNQARIPSH